MAAGPDGLFQVSRLPKVDERIRELARRARSVDMEAPLSAGARRDAAPVGTRPARVGRSRTWLIPSRRHDLPCAHSAAIRALRCV
jgi:hypothetical protein